MLPTFVLLILGVLSLSSGLKCPDNCHCVQSSINCSHQNLTAVVIHIQSDDVLLDNQSLSDTDTNHSSLIADLYINQQTIESLDFSDNQIQQFNKNVFLSLQNLRSLNLSHNYLTSISNITMISLESLTILDLSYNQLSADVLDQVQVLSKLKYLYLNNNNIQLMPVISPMPDLILLDLTNNPIFVIHPDQFLFLPSLISLYMANTSLQHLDKMEGLNQLEYLNLDFNNITVIQKAIFPPNLRILSLANMTNLVNISHTAFQGLAQLKQLNLSYNPNLQFIHPDLFKPLVSLQVLNLSSTGLQQLSEITFYNNQELIKVDLKENFFNCSCVNIWLVHAANKFLSSLQCTLDNGQLQNLTSVQCQPIQLHNITNTVHAQLGSQLLLKCPYDADEPGIIKWVTPTGSSFYYHYYHPNAVEHLLTPADIEPDSEFHKDHEWHYSSSYYPEVSSLSNRILLLSDGSLYIDYMLRTDTGSYKCHISNAHYNQSTRIEIFLNCKLSTDIKIFAIIVGLLCALAFFTLNLIHVIISWIARRLVNKRRREIIRQMLENLNIYKTTQISRIHENYTHQLARVRNQYHTQRDKLHRNYTSQVTKMKRGCSNQVEKVRDNYNSKLSQLRDYSSNQIIQIRERANNQIVRIRDYGCNQLDKLRETYKLQQQHVLKLLDTMNLENCRNVVETECMRTESMMFDIDLLGDDRIDSPLSEYTTAASSPATSLEESCDVDFMHPPTNLSSSSSENCSVIHVQTTIDMEQRGVLWQCDSEEHIAGFHGDTAASLKNQAETHIEDSASRNQEGDGAFVTPNSSPAKVQTQVEDRMFVDYQSTLSNQFVSETNV